MHVLNLGVDLWIVGNILKKLLSHLPALWGPGSDDCRLYIAWQEFKEWCRLNKYECPAASVLYMLNCSKKKLFFKDYVYVEIHDPPSPQHDKAKAQHAKILLKAVEKFPT